MKILTFFVELDKLDFRFMWMNKWAEHQRWSCWSWRVSLGRWEAAVALCGDKDTGGGGITTGWALLEASHHPSTKTQPHPTACRLQCWDTSLNTMINTVSKLLYTHQPEMPRMIFALNLALFLYFCPFLLPFLTTVLYQFSRHVT